ncbi:MAG TPA: prolipoprotein diacylglyceryl transferase [bacterium]|nr:prolipoprotein diacylglyceryl transferase [bacterium]
MHPVLFEIKGFKIYTYGPIMALGFLAAFFLIYHIARRRKEDVEFYMDLYVWLILFGLLGAKLLYNIIEYQEFFAHPIQMMNCRNGGLVWYGGVILDTLFLIWYTRRRQVPFLQVSDTLSAPAALGLAIGRWGCLMGGCCYGKPCSLPWAVVYPQGANPVAGIPVHPSPIYESIASLIICAVIYLAIRKQAKTGIATAIWFTLYPLARFLLEFIRGDEVRGFVYQGASFSISTSQFIGLIVIAGAIGLTVWIHRHPPIPLVTYDPEQERAANEKAREQALKKKKDRQKAGKSKG